METGVFSTAPLPIQLQSLKSFLFLKRRYLTPTSLSIGLNQMLVNLWFGVKEAGVRQVSWHIKDKTNFRLLKRNAMEG